MAPDHIMLGVGGEKNCRKQTTVKLGGFYFE